MTKLGMPKIDRKLISRKEEVVKVTIHELFHLFNCDSRIADPPYLIKIYQQFIKKLPKVKGVKEILYPGQSKFKRYKINLKKVINLPKNILEDLKKLDA